LTWRQQQHVGMILTSGTIHNSYNHAMCLLR
jgi:hypothetical protein